MSGLLSLALLSGCASGVDGDRGGDEPGGQEEIAAMLHASAEAWNRGDLDGFLDDYAEDATFVGSSRIRGVAAIRARYVESYWSGGEPPTDLRFEDLEVTVLGPGSALAVGRYVLYDPASEATQSTGFFTLIVRRTPDGWRIVHDHSSEAE